MMIHSFPTTKNKTLQSKYVFEKRLFKVLVSLFVLSICLYVYSISSVIYGVVSRRTLEKEITLLHSDIGKMESEYLQKTDSLTYTGATVLGYTKPEKLYYESEERVAFQDTKDKRNGL